MREHPNEQQHRGTMGREQTDVFESALDEAISSFGIKPLTDEQTAQLVRHYSLLCLWNQRLNLTRITGPREAATLHYAESLFGASFISGERTLVDIGSGAGFPAIPIAVARPDVQVTALETNQKKSVFLKEAKDEMGLGNLVVVTARVEEFDWSGFELLTSRALDRAEVVLPLIIQRLSPRQRLMLYCGPDLVARLEGGAKVETHPIPHSEARLIAIFGKEQTTNDADQTDRHRSSL